MLTILLTSLSFQFTKDIIVPKQQIDAIYTKMLQSRPLKSRYGLMPWSQFLKDSDIKSSEVGSRMEYSIPGMDIIANRRGIVTGMIAIGAIGEPAFTSLSDADLNSRAVSWAKVLRPNLTIGLTDTKNLGYSDNPQLFRTELGIFPKYKSVPIGPEPYISVQLARDTGELMVGSAGYIVPELARPKKVGVEDSVVLAMSSMFKMNKGLGQLELSNEPNLYLTGFGLALVGRWNKDNLLVQEMVQDYRGAYAYDLVLVDSTSKVKFPNGESHPSKVFFVMVSAFDGSILGWMDGSSGSVGKVSPYVSKQILLNRANLEFGSKKLKLRKITLSPVMGSSVSGLELTIVSPKLAIRGIYDPIKGTILINEGGERHLYLVDALSNKAIKAMSGK